MSRISSAKTERVMQNDLIEGIVNLRITYSRASMPTLEALTFRDPKAVMAEISSLPSVLECTLLQTCNRVEVYAVVSPKKSNTSAQTIAEYWRGKFDFGSADFYSALEISFGQEALLHLLRLTSGLESMIVGEDQILGQVQESLEGAKGCGAIGPILQRVFERAIKTGKTIRFKTQINKGAVSVGSIAVKLLEKYLGDLEHKKILIIGAGQIATLVGKALTARRTPTVFVANRNFKRAAWLGKILNAQAVGLDRLTELLTVADAAVVATAAPHYVLTRDLISAATERRKDGKLLIIDLSQPRNVEESAANLPNVELQNIDNLRGIAQVNLQMRLGEAKKAEMMLQDELRKLVNSLKRERIEPIISALYGKAEKIRCREVEKAFELMASTAGSDYFQMKKCRQCMKIVEDLSRELIERTLLNPVLNLRKAAENNDFNKILAAREIFDIIPKRRRG